MIVTIELTAQEEVNLRRLAAKKGKDEQAVALRLLSGLLADERNEPSAAESKNRSMAE
jgi:hypothetical protein